MKKLLYLNGLFFSQIIFAQTSALDNSSPLQMGSSEFLTEKNYSPKEVIDLNISELENDPVLRNAEWGFVLYDPKNQKVINSYNEYSALIPASTTKLLTTETALSLLGADFRWITQLDYSGTIGENGVLDGNLYIVGSGDPTLGNGKAGGAYYGALVSQFTNAVKDLGIKKIAGDIVIETAVFKQNKKLPPNIVWGEQKDYFLPAGSVSSVNPENEKPVNSLREEAGKKYFFYTSPFSGKSVFAENYASSPMNSTVPTQLYSFANSFKISLAKNKILVSGKISARTTDSEPEERTQASRYTSPTLNDVIYYTNQNSDNALAESLLKINGFFGMGDFSKISGADAVQAHFNEKKYDFSGLYQADGSGLSRENVVTPMSQVKFLSEIMKEPYFQDFKNSLPIAGQTGTLKKTFLYSPCYGQVFAKTGTLNKVKALSGYLRTFSGKTLTFSILMNNFSGSVDQIKNRMAKLLEPALNL